jgi:hypothetical protein
MTTENDSALSTGAEKSGSPGAGYFAASSAFSSDSEMRDVALAAMAMLALRGTFRIRSPRNWPAGTSVERLAWRGAA